ncbi:MAG: PqqD family protein [Bdellovibrionales bacterium]
MQVSRDILSKTLSGEEVLMDLANGNYYGLNETGTRIWQAVKAGRTEAQIAEDLAADYGINANEALADVREFCALLQSENLLQP